MNTLYLTREQARQVDQFAASEFGVDDLVLMENAGRGCSDVLLRNGVRGPVLICCGKGNNGGDGLVMARHLLIRGIASRTLIWGTVEQLSPSALANCRILERGGYPVHWISSGAGLERLEHEAQGVDWVVDALLGTGALGPPRSPLDEVIRFLNQRLAPRFAIDSPSGLDADSGVPANPTIRAALTCTMVAQKVGFQNRQAQAVLGTVEVVEIGIPLAWVVKTALLEH